MWACTRRLCAETDAETLNTLCDLLRLHAQASEFIRRKHKPAYIFLGFDRLELARCASLVATASKRSRQIC
ncbi:hypothetical protein ABIF72_007756 [Bradyrhizobium japonicum]